VPLKCSALCLTAGLVLLAPRIGAQRLPSYCDQISPTQLIDVAVPYSLRTRDNVQWCEGILPSPAAIRLLDILSVKRVRTPAVPMFRRNDVASLSWCAPPSADEALIRVRSLASPLYALDAASPSAFQWPLRFAASLQPDWARLAVMITRPMPIDGHAVGVWLPARLATGSANDYEFIVHGDAATLGKVLIEPTTEGGKPIVRNVAFSALDEMHFAADVSFVGFPQGIYAVSFSDAAEDAGRTTNRVYIYHGKCTDR
jgi:hypothetical protein